MSYDVDVESASDVDGDAAAAGDGPGTPPADVCEGCTDADGVETFEATVEDELVVVYV